MRRLLQGRLVSGPRRRTAGPMLPHQHVLLLLLLIRHCTCAKRYHAPRACLRATAWAAATARTNSAASSSDDTLSHQGEKSAPAAAAAAAVARCRRCRRRRSLPPPLLLPLPLPLLPPSGPAPSPPATCTLLHSAAASDTPWSSAHGAGQLDPSLLISSADRPCSHPVSRPLARAPAPGQRHGQDSSYLCARGAREARTTPCLPP